MQKIPVHHIITGTTESDTDGVQKFPMILIVDSLPYRTFALIGWRKGLAFREETGGPLIDGPRLNAYSQAGYITSDPEQNSGADLRRAEAAGLVIHCAFGDTIEALGGTYVIERAPNDNLHFRTLAIHEAE